DFGSKEEQAYQAAREFSKLFCNTFDKKRHESLGHSSLMRYYRQNIAPNRRENSGIPPKMLAQCKALGWTGATGVTGTQFTHAVLQTKHCSKSKRKFWDSSKNVSTMQSFWVDWRNSVGDASSKYLLTGSGLNETQGTVLTYNNWRFSTYDRHHKGSGVNCRLQGSMVV
ncbi:hypothetical protein ScPMuIL_002101, partial [Solemya velum]